MNDGRAIGLELGLNTIQEIRVAAALLESSFRVHVGPAASVALRAWTEYFGGTFAIGLDGVPLARSICVDHRAPATNVGSIRKTLLFPRGMVDRCRGLWTAEREFHYSFGGLPTPTRRHSLTRWARAHFGLPGAAVVIPSMPRGPRLWLSHLTRGYHEYRRIHAEFGLLVSFSDRGRRFPVKVWDERYFQDLGRSRFVLCPNGDFVWTYRFFEAVLCGAIPIVERSCSAYDRYRYFTMDTPRAELEYAPDVARANFERAVEQLTVSRGELDAALDELRQTPAGVRTTVTG